MRLIAVLLLIISMLACAPKKAEKKPDLTAQAAQSTSQTEPLTPVDPTIGLDKGDPATGRDYFYGESRGRCLRCHTLNGEGEPGGWALDDTGLRRDPEWLAIFLNNPRFKRPEVARMPPFRGDEKAKLADVVAFLMTLKTSVDHPAPSDLKPADEPEKYEGGVGGRKGEGFVGGGD